MRKHCQLLDFHLKFDRLRGKSPDFLEITGLVSRPWSFLVKRRRFHIVLSSYGFFCTALFIGNALK